MNNLAYHLQQASLFELLANYYKYSNPHAHMMYYQKHLYHAQQVAQISLGMESPYSWQRQPEPRQQAGSSTFLRLFHTVPDAPAVDVYVNRKPVQRGVSFGEYSNYLTLPAGQHHIALYAAGQTERPILSEVVRAQPDRAYTAAAAGKMNRIHFFPYVDDLMTVPNQAKVRFIHLSPDAPAVTLLAPTGYTLFANVPFQGVTNYITVPAGNVQFTIRPVGSTKNLLSVSHPVEAGHNYTIAAIGLANGQPGITSLQIPDEVDQEGEEG